VASVPVVVSEMAFRVDGQTRRLGNQVAGQGWLAALFEDGALDPFHAAVALRTASGDEDAHQASDPIGQVPFCLTNSGIGQTRCRPGRSRSARAPIASGFMIGVRRRLIRASNYVRSSRVWRGGFF